MAFPMGSNTAGHAYGINSTSEDLPPRPPVVLVIHGAWHTPAYYFPLLHALTTTGFMTLCPQLPSCTNVLPPPCSLSDDVNMIRNLALDLANRGHPIIAIMHSYGGVVGTEALAGLGWHVRQEERVNQGQDPDTLIGGVVALIYMTAFMLPVGFSLATPFGGKLPPFMTEHADGTCTMNEPYLRFFSTDVTDDQAEQPGTPSIPQGLPCLAPSFLLAHLTNHPTAAQTTSVTRAAYLDTGMSTTYLICENDMALVPEGQRGIIQMARSNGVDVYEETCQGGHSPFLSVPGDIALVVQRAWVRWATGGRATCVGPESTEVNGQVHKDESAQKQQIVNDSTIAQGTNLAACTVGNDETADIEGDNVDQAHGNMLGKTNEGNSVAHAQGNTFGEINEGKFKSAQEASNAELPLKKAGYAQEDNSAQVHSNKPEEAFEEKQQEIPENQSNGSNLANAANAHKDEETGIKEENTDVIKEDNTKVLPKYKDASTQVPHAEATVAKNTKDLLEPKPINVHTATIASVLPKREDTTKNTTATTAAQKFLVLTAPIITSNSTRVGDIPETPTATKEPTPSTPFPTTATEAAVPDPGSSGPLTFSLGAAGNGHVDGNGKQDMVVLGASERSEFELTMCHGGWDE